MDIAKELNAVYGAIFETLQISRRRIKSPERTRNVVFARVVACTIMYHAGMSSEEIAKELNILSPGLVRYYRKCYDVEKSAGFIALRDKIVQKYFEYRK